VNESQVFTDALKLATPAERDAFLDGACAGDPALRAAVDCLLRAHDRHPDFLERPIETLSGTLAATTAGAGPPPVPTGLVIAGRYKLLEEIGEGGMGTVWMAQQHEPVKRLVAIKLIKPGMDSRQVLARFEAERQALALMDHPNIAKVHDGGATPEGRPFFVMELVKGVPITNYCDDHRLTVRQRLELFVPVCQAVQHAHQKGVIHRDLKPSNVLVALYDERPVPKVIDFGVAKAAGEQLTERTLQTGFGAVVGTVEYMSPEQASFNNLDIDTRSDIYSLGVLLYELLTGTTPLQKKMGREVALLDMLRMIRDEDPPRPSIRLSTSEGLPSTAASRGAVPKKLTGLLGGELDWIVMKALEKDRNRRYETASAFAADVQRYLADEPVLACPPSAGYRFRKFARRNRGPVLAASLVFLALIGGVIGTTWGLIREEHARQREEDERRTAEANADRAVKNLAQAQLGFDKANDAVEQYLKAVTEDADLKHKYDLRALRKRLLEAAVPFFQWFTQQRPDEPVLEAQRGRAYGRLAAVRVEFGETEGALTDYERMQAVFARLVTDYPSEPEYRQYLARSHNSAGLLLKKLGQWNAADQAFRQALEIREQLAAEFPSEIEYQQEVARSHNNRAILLAEQRQGLAAEQAFRRALEIREKLAARFPKNPEHRYELARSHGNLATAMNDAAQKPAAERAFRTALDIFETLAAEFPGMPAYRQDLAMCHNNLGAVLSTQGKWEAAEHSHRRALEIQEKLTTQFPTAVDYRHDLAMSAINFGALLRDRGQAEASLEWYTKAITLLEPVLRREPRLVTERKYLRDAHWGRAEAQDTLGRSSDAVKDWDRALELGPAPEQQQVARRKRALALARAGDHAKVLAAAKDLDGGTLYDIASITALAALHVGNDAKLQDEHAARAIELLRRAVAAGYTDVAQLKRDKNLDALRNRDDWPKLVAGLEARADQVVVARRRAIDRNATDAGAHDSLGIALEKRGNQDEAIAEYREALRLKPDLYQAQDNLGRVAWQLAAGPDLKARDPERAAGLVRHVLDLNPKPPWLAGYAPILLLTGDVAAYRQVCAQVLDQFGDTTDARTAYLVARIGGLGPDAVSDPDLLVRLADRAVQAEPVPHYLHVLGLAHYRAGDFNRAIERLTESVNGNWSGNAANWLVLAMAHYRLGNAGDARKWFDQAVRTIDPPGAREPDAGLRGLHRHDVTACVVLRREAEVLLGLRPGPLPGVKAPGGKD